MLEVFLSLIVLWIVSTTRGKKFIVENKFAIWILVAVVFSVFGIASILIGCQQNGKVSHIKKYGVRTTAQVIQKKMKDPIIYWKGDVSQYDYLVEFVEAGGVRQGKGVTGERFLEKAVDIYYIPDATSDVVDVAIADRDDKPGRNNIYHGVLALLLALGFFLDLIRKKNA